jgi:hypothetical protein
MFAAFALTAQVQDRSGPTAIEHAMAEFTCRLTAVSGPDSYQTCYGARLAALRADFGRDLERLTPAERRGIDSACTPVRDAQGRDAYLQCLSGQLAAIAVRRIPGGSPLPSGESPSLAPGTEIAGMQAASGQAAPDSSGGWLWVAVVGLGATAAGGAYFAFSRPRRIQRVCRECGTDLATPGDLCAPCRHAAADAARRQAESGLFDPQMESERQSQVVTDSLQ